jgi:hypothetical protein
MRHAIKRFGQLALVLVFTAAISHSAGARPDAVRCRDLPMKRDTNAVPWHTIKVTTGPDLPEIRWYDKFNPVWWLQNADEPVPPSGYLPDDRHRKLKWGFRNPCHNVCFYVIGVADKETVRSGHHPERDFNPHGGWNLEVTRRRLVLLPFVSYERSWGRLYLGWRTCGAFGVELRFHRAPEPGARKAGG